MFKQLPFDTKCTDMMYCQTKIATIRCMKVFHSRGRMTFGINAREARRSVASPIIIPIGMIGINMTAQSSNYVQRNRNPTVNDVQRRVLQLNDNS